MMLVFPYQYLGVKVFFIVIIVLAFFINGGFVTLIPKYQKWILIFLGMNMIYSIYGLVLNNPGVNHYLLLFIAWPILYFIFCSFVNREAINKLFKVSFYAFGTIVIIGVISFLQINGYLLHIINTDFWGLDYGDRPLFVFQAIKAASTVSFIFLFPFYLTMLIIDKTFSKSLINKIILVFSLIYMFVTTRRALIFSLLYMPLLIYFFDKMSINKSEDNDSSHTLRKLIKLFGIPILLILFISIYFKLIDLSIFSDLFSASFSSDDDSLGSDRNEQSVALIDGWLKSPIFGAGPGIDAGVSRSDIPGNYELSYLALLFSRGAFGFLVYFGQIFLLIYWGVKLSKYEDPLKPYIVSFNVAFISFLISNGSNPYLDAYDHMWVIYLYIALQNVIYKTIENNETNLHSD
jgi:hypothetical protein